VPEAERAPGGETGRPATEPVANRAPDGEIGRVTAVGRRAVLSAAPAEAALLVGGGVRGRACTSQEGSDATVWSGSGTQCCWASGHGSTAGGGSS
jgi:hypothetical protein